MSDIILHHYDASPFTQKALRMLGLKRLAWRSVQTPMMPPKDDLVALTGGYRGTPVMQIGADVYIDSQLIAQELERRHPQPSLFPAGDVGMGFMLTKWSETFFRSNLAIAVEQTAASWPEPFLNDRKQLFPDFDFAAAQAGTQHARTQFRVHAGWLDAQLGDGRAFLTGTLPGLADLQAQVFVWMARAYFPAVATALLAQFTHLPAWEARVAALGEGQRSEIDAAEAFAVARGARPCAARGVDAQDPLGLAAGDMLDITPDDTRRGMTRGTLAALSWDRLAVRREHPLCGEVMVHFPRVGYRITQI